MAPALSEWLCARHRAHPHRTVAARRGRTARHPRYPKGNRREENQWTDTREQQKRFGFRRRSNGRSRSLTNSWEPPNPPKRPSDGVKSAANSATEPIAANVIPGPWRPLPLTVRLEREI